MINYCYKRFWLVGLLIAIYLLSGTFSIEASSDWKLDQEKMFTEISLKPGDKISSENWKKVENLLPSSQLQWLKDGKFTMTIGETGWSYRSDNEWIDASRQNDGKYKLNANKSILESNSGKLPKYIYGEPFPNIDMQKDPDAGIKIMDNQNALANRHGAYREDFMIDWVGANGFERYLLGIAQHFHFWYSPKGEQTNSQQYLYLDSTFVQEPYDIAGMATSLKRYISDEADLYYAYLPSIRRTKKMSGANRSDPFAGSDFTHDDSNGWAGKNTSMTWKVLGEKTMLMPILPTLKGGPVIGKEQPDGSFVPADFETLKVGYEVENSNGAAWFPQNLIWVPRKMYITEAIPKDPYYNYGRMVYYIDPHAGIVSKIIYDQAGEYWKTLMMMAMPIEYNYKGKVRQVFSNAICYLVFNEKTKHACIGFMHGKHHGIDLKAKFVVNDLTPRQFDPDVIGTQSR